MLKCHKCLAICIRGSQICQLYASELQSKLLLACLSASAGLLFFKSLFWKGINVCDSPVSVLFVSILVSIFVYLYLTAVMAVGRGGPNWCAHTALQLARQPPLKVKVEGVPSTRYIYIQKSASILYVEGVEVDNYLHNPKPILWFRGSSVARTFSRQIWWLRRFFYCKKGHPPPPPPSPKPPEPQISLNINIFKYVIIYISPIMK